MAKQLTSDQKNTFIQVILFIKRRRPRRIKIVTGYASRTFIHQVWRSSYYFHKGKMLISERKNMMHDIMHFKKQRRPRVKWPLYYG